MAFLVLHHVMQLQGFRFSFVHTMWTVWGRVSRTIFIPLKFKETSDNFWCISRRVRSRNDFFFVSESIFGIASTKKWLKQFHNKFYASTVSLNKENLDRDHNQKPQTNTRKGKVMQFLGALLLAAGERKNFLIAMEILETDLWCGNLRFDMEIHSNCTHKLIIILKTEEKLST